jgi:hypothetical protein
MSEHEDAAPVESGEVGYGKPPRSTQFQKGKSGNPKGRPKGSRSLATVLAQMGRQRVKVNVNGRVRHISKLEAVIMQLSNKAANGDVKAIRELLVAHRIFPEPEESRASLESSPEREASVMKNMLDRIRICETVSTTDVPETSQEIHAE